MSTGLLSLLGIIIGLVLLIGLSFRGLSLIILGPIVSAVVLLFSSENIIEGLTGPYATAFANFAQSNFLLFLPAIILGQMLGECGAANDIAYAIANIASKSKRNAKFATLMGLSVITAVLSFGGVSGFVVVFTVAPICKGLFKKLDIPWHFVIAILVYGGSMWTAILPGSPAIQNLIPMDYLGTKPTAGPWIGIIIALWCIVTGALYIYWQLKRSERRNEGFSETGAAIDKVWPDDATIEEHGSVLKALMPSIVLIVTMNLFGFEPEVALFLGVITCAVLYYNKFDNLSNLLTESGKKTATTVINVCAVVGFGGIIKEVAGFQFLIDGLDAVPGPPLIQLALATNLIAGITGSASGGEGIALEVLAPQYVSMGINPDVIHRIVNISCYGLDSLPHNGSVITRLNHTKLSHKTGYYHEFILGAILPFFNSFLAYMGIV
ncbi:H+/gluconate symporter-like permease [Enterococcus sp. PF1-24]|uniref:GntP family permease n=1 Tax=unclassified Enterococcus TaxID=2608891 RepID=UPI0024772DA8|nr:MULTISPECIES: SLC13 family permease [unclassified Enterococcus]MDH6364106.1 H+/gluconate symporter-like permease [Enterococcus sp. PFB1-1]MDH6401207.1 H+/gluconate symporter-like permease [Enterococcus sp. PF1-24]